MYKTLNFHGDFEFFYFYFSHWLTKAGGVVECQVVHHSGTKEAPPEEEILCSLFHIPTALLAWLIKTQEQKQELLIRKLMYRRSVGI